MGSEMCIRDRFVYRGTIKKRIIFDPKLPSEKIKVSFIRLKYFFFKLHIPPHSFLSAQSQAKMQKTSFFLNFNILLQLEKL